MWNHPMRHMHPMGSTDIGWLVPNFTYFYSYFLAKNTQFSTPPSCPEKLHSSCLWDLLALWVKRESQEMKIRKRYVLLGTGLPTPSLTSQTWCHSLNYIHTPLLMLPMSSLMPHAYHHALPMLSFTSTHCCCLDLILILVLFVVLLLEALFIKFSHIVRHEIVQVGPSDTCSQVAPGLLVHRYLV